MGGENSSHCSVGPVATPYVALSSEAALVRMSAFFATHLIDSLARSAGYLTRYRCRAAGPENVSLFSRTERVASELRRLADISGPRTDDRIVDTHVVAADCPDHPAQFDHELGASRLAGDNVQRNENAVHFGNGCQVGSQRTRQQGVER